jgi:hypothetical protein
MPLEPFVGVWRGSSASGPIWSRCAVKPMSTRYRVWLAGAGRLHQEGYRATALSSAP